MIDMKGCPFCGGEIEENGGSCNYGKHIMTLDVKCRQCGTGFKFKAKWELNPYVEAVEAWNRRINGAADTVPVVRCKECKHHRDRTESEKNYLADGVLLCTSPDAVDECWNPVWPDHFCSYGERADGGAD